jgi:hypothetical protein
MWPRPANAGMEPVLLGHFLYAGSYLGLRRVSDASSPEATRCRPLRGLPVMWGIHSRSGPILTWCFSGACSPTFSARRDADPVRGAAEGSQPAKRATAGSHGRQPMVGELPSPEPRTRRQQFVGIGGGCMVGSAKQCGLGRQTLGWSPFCSAIFFTLVRTSGYVASPTLPHPRLPAAALFEGFL